MRFRVFIDKQMVGESALEGGDPPMGVVYGELVPTEAYFQYQEVFQRNDYKRINEFHIYVLCPNGERLSPCDGVGILDYSHEAGEQSIEVNVLGLDEGSYCKYFQSYIDDYNNRHE